MEETDAMLADVPSATGFVEELRSNGNGPMAPAWLPISTAPQNRHVILATADGHVGEGYWDNGGWWWAGGESALMRTPPHWMPLPEGPKT